MEHHSEGSVSSDTHKRKKRCNRHTANQIQRLEAVFKTCSYPDEKQRLQLGRELAMDPTKIKFWFQNRRTQMKTQHERDDNCTVIEENDKIRSENKVMMEEALENVICSTCDGQKLRIENARLKEELLRVSSIAAGYTGKSLQHLLPGSSSTLPNIPYDQPAGLSNKEKSLMFDIATNAMQELVLLMETNEPLWMKSNTDGRDTLNLETYETMFPRANNRLKNPNIRIEASRNSGDVIMNALTLVEMFMDPNKWMELFPTIVTMAKTIEVISSRTKDGLSGSLQLMYEELQVLSPLVPIREFYFLRYCKQFEKGWVIVDVSYEFAHNKHFDSKFRGHRLPSGCFIQDMPNGKSKVTWIEHVEVEDRNPVHMLYRNVIYSGVAFGAEKWLTTLQRMCERLAYLMDSGNSGHLEGVIPSPDGKRTMMKLTQRMVTNFCESINASASHRWTTLSTLNEITVRKTQSNGEVLSASTTIWLPLPPQTVFNFLKDERKRSQSNVLSNGNNVQEVVRIANVSHPGNFISVFKGFSTSNNTMLRLQESCVDSSGSLVVSCPVDSSIMSEVDPSYIQLLPSGFIITSDGKQNNNNIQGGNSGNGDVASTSSNTNIGGSLLTVAFQIMVSSLPSNMESVPIVNGLIGKTVQHIKAALNCPM